MTLKEFYRKYNYHIWLPIIYESIVAAFIVVAIVYIIVITVS